MSILTCDLPVTHRPSIREIAALHLGLQWFPEGGGGADRVYWDLVRSLPGAGVSCGGLVAGSADVARESDGAVRAFAPANSSMWHRLASVRAAVGQELNDGNIDLVTSHFALYAWPALRMIRRRGLPLVVHFHGPWAAEAQAEGAGRASVSVKRAVERAVYRGAERLIVLSEAFGKILVDDYGVPADRIRRIPPGIDMARFSTGLTRHEARERLDWPTDRPVVLAVRRLVSRMGLENLISAAAAFRKTMPDVLVLIAGKGPLHDSLAARVRDLGLSDHVRLLGFVPDDDLPLAYAAADLTVVPSVALEGFGMIVPESLASGTPALVTPVGGLPESVRPLCPQLVMPGTTPDDLVASIGAALRGELPLPSAEQCRAYAETTHDPQVVAGRIRAVYEEALR